MAYNLGVEIKDEMLDLIYGKTGWRRFDILEKDKLRLQKGIICNGIIEDEEALSALLIGYFRKKNWYPSESSILIPIQCVVRREISMPMFMENHLETYLATYPEQWMDEALQDYLFTAYRIEAMNEQMGRYCLVGSIREVILKPYALFKKLKCTPLYISTPLDVLQPSMESLKEGHQQLLLLEREERWYIGIYKRGICILASTVMKEGEEKLVVEISRLLEFYARQATYTQIEQCCIVWQQEANQLLVSSIKEAFDIQVKCLGEAVFVNGWMKRFQGTCFTRRAL